MKVLIVDDSSTMRRMLKKHLSKRGIEDTVQAKDGQEALDKLAENRDVKLVLCDWNMPVMDGLECLKKFRSDAANKDIIFVMVTTESDKSNIVQAIQNGANNYILKPFTEEEFLSKIDQIIPANK